MNINVYEFQSNQISKTYIYVHIMIRNLFIITSKISLFINKNNNNS